MEYQFDILRATRKNVLAILNSSTLEELNTIPEGYSNNLIWNATHIVVTQQLLVYGLSGLPLSIPSDLVTGFRKGTRPAGDVEQGHVDLIIELLESIPDKTQSDLKNGVFKESKEYMTSYGIGVKSVEEAIPFNNSHEALHLGYMMAIRKAIQIPQSQS